MLAQKEPRQKANAAKLPKAKEQLPALPLPPQQTEPDGRFAPLTVAIPRKALSMAEAGHVAGVTKAVIRQEIKRGRLPAFRVGYRRIRIPVEALQKYLRDRQAEGVV